MAEEEEKTMEDKQEESKDLEERKEEEEGEEVTIDEKLERAEEEQHPPDELGVEREDEGEQEEEGERAEEKTKREEEQEEGEQEEKEEREEEEERAEEKKEGEPLTSPEKEDEYLAMMKAEEEEKKASKEKEEELLEEKDIGEELSLIKSKQRKADKKDKKEEEKRKKEGKAPEETEEIKGVKRKKEEEKETGAEEEVTEECDKPKIYALRTTANREDQVMDFVTSNAARKKLRVYSVIRPHGMRGYIFLEAASRADAEQAAFGVPYARGLLPNIIQYNEIEHMLEQVKKEMNIQKNDIAEIISGPFKREKCKITRIDRAKEEVVVELLEAAVPIPITVKMDAVRVIRRDKEEG
ncbi:MAG TPA: transcription elongation factor Spt5 [Candidatus Woesearchaeota archaeon]|nr:transcription elongation factor Spt5 [Candidatus Woesearchaeota archaeon]